MSDATTALPFDIADRYVVAAELGRGGFAVVYRAWDRTLERDVAIKILSSESLPASALRRFSLELQVTAKLEHPNILHVYDTGTWEGRPYYVMEYVRGQTLEAQLAAEGALQVEDALSITRDIGHALAFAHESGVIHRDVKPANVLLRLGTAILGDFGIAHVLDATTGGPITSTGFAVGTMQYMSPEQLCAEPKIDARSDQYSLALIFYEMLTGVQPHVASKVDALRALRLSGGFAPVSAHRPSVPSYVDDVFARALSPAPADRFRDVREFLAAFEDGSVAASDRVISRGGVVRSGGHSWPRVASISAAEGVAHARRRSRRTAWVVGAVFIVAALGAAGMRYVSPRFAVASDANGGASPSIALLADRAGSDSSLTTHVRAELDAWNDVTVLPDVRAEGLRLDASGLNALQRAASTARATLLIRPATTTISDSVRWSLSVFDPRTARITRISRAGRVGSTIDGLRLREMVMLALVGAVADSTPGLTSLREPVLGAARLYAEGWRLLRAGAFDSARKSFEGAGAAAPSFGEAQLWAAQLGAWMSPRDARSWRDASRRAAAVPTALAGADSLLASALVALAGGDPPAACARYRVALAGMPDSFAAWYGLGQCQHIDAAVVRDPLTPGGRRFRSSHWSALRSYEEALARLPSPRMGSLFVDVAPLTYASGNMTRRGIAVAPDTGTFLAVPSFAGDSVVTLPIPAAEVIRGAVPESFSVALERARRAFQELTRLWVTRAPSASAWFNRAYALELIGAYDASERINSAAGSLELADSLATDDEFRARVDVARVRVAVRRGSFATGKHLAQVALARNGSNSPATAILHAPLAAFLLDVGQTTSLLRTASMTTDESLRYRLPQWSAASLPPRLADSVRAFGVRALLGVCDGLEERRAALEGSFRQSLAAAELAERRQTVLRQVYRAAIPCLGAGALQGFAPETPLDEAVAALNKGDTARVRTILKRIDGARRGMRAVTVTEDVLLAEAWVRTQSGDVTGALSRLRANIDDPGVISAFTFDEIPQAAALSRIRNMVAH